MAMDINRKFEATYIPHLIVDVLLHYSETTFEAAVQNEGKYITKHSIRSSGRMDDYNLKKGGCFTFDGIRYFKIIGTAIQNDMNGYVIFTFQYIESPTFSEKNTAFMIMPFGHDELISFTKKILENI